MTDLTSPAGAFDKQGYFFSFTWLTHEFHMLSIFIIFKGNVNTVGMASGGCLLYGKVATLPFALIGSHLVY